MMAAFTLPMVTRPTRSSMKLSPAPTYMSLTAVCTEAGIGGRCDSGVCPEDGYGWYIAAP
jgi:hypothetical protein